MIELYGCSSGNVRKVIICLAELGIEYQATYVDIMRRGGRTEAFLQLNPLGRVPVLVDSSGPARGEPIFESGAILIYLAEAYGGEALLPQSGHERYAVLKWLMVQVATIGPIFGQHNHFIVTAGAGDSYAAARYRNQSLNLYKLLDQRLAETRYLAGDFYSLADIATFPWATRVENHGFEWADFPNIAGWRDRIELRPAVQRSISEMASFIESDAASAAAATQQDLDSLYWAEGGRTPHVDFKLLFRKGMDARKLTGGA